MTAERSRYRMESKRGVLLIGDGHARLDDGGRRARVTLDARRATWWMRDATVEARTA